MIFINDHSKNYQLIKIQEGPNLLARQQHYLRDHLYNLRETPEYPGRR